MTTPHPTPEERYEAAGRDADAKFEHQHDSAAYLSYSRDVMIAALRQAYEDGKRDEREAYRAAIADAEQALTDAADYFGNRADVNDGDYGVPEPNTEMRLASQCDEANNRLSAIRARTQSEPSK